MRRRTPQPVSTSSKPPSSAGGFSLIELLIVVAIILIIAAIAIPNFMRSRMAANESATVENLRNISTAEVVYSTTYGIGFSATLANLGTAGGPPTAAAAQLVDDILAKGVRSGYTVTYVPTPPTGGIIYNYMINADPTVPGVTGQRHFFTDQTGVIRFNPSAPATAASAPIG